MFAERMNEWMNEWTNSDQITELEGLLEDDLVLLYFQANKHLNEEIGHQNN